MNPAGLTFRTQVRKGDDEAIRELVRSTGFFNEEEIRIAGELVEERLAKGVHSGYHFLLAEREGGRLAGYSCFGPIDGTQGHSFDFFWLAVDNELRGQGIGGVLVRKTEEIIGAMGGKRIYVETSGREQYDPTRAFYRKQGYAEEARLEEFYGPGDAKVFYVKTITSPIGRG